jgi:hypothetical protein
MGLPVFVERKGMCSQDDKSAHLSQLNTLAAAAEDEYPKISSK